jgi:microcompartment protein CcmK/EutM
MPGSEPYAPSGPNLAVCCLAGIGNAVLLSRVGSAAPRLLKNPDACLIPGIVGFVDSVFIQA